MDLNELLDVNRANMARTLPPEIVTMMSSLDDTKYAIRKMLEGKYDDMVLQLSQFLAYHGEWVRINVEKELSDELMDTVMHDITPEDVAPLFNSMEFVFQDDRYPTILFYAKTPEYLETVSRHVPELTIYSEYKQTYCMSYYTRDGIAHMLNVPPEQLAAWMRGDVEIGVLRGCVADDEGHGNEFKKQLLTMIIKVMLYASIPLYKPVDIGINHKGLTRSERGAFGLPNPACTKAFIVRPPVIKLRDTEGYGTPGSGTKSPHRRVGHFNILRSARFKNKVGQRVYIRPCYIHGGTVSDHIYEIRKRGDDGERDGGIQKSEGG